MVPGNVKILPPPKKKNIYIYFYECKADHNIQVYTYMNLHSSINKIYFEKYEFC